MPNNENRDEIRISGMTCASCAAGVERAVKKLEGVKSAAVNLATEKLTVSYDRETLSLDRIRQEVEKIGFRAGEREENLVIPIGGMTCASCSAHVQRELSAVHGVKSAAVNLASEKATVAYYPDKTNPGELIAVIERAGYRALTPAKQRGEPQEQKDAEIKRLKAKFIIAAIFALPLLYLAMAPMLPWISASIPKFLEPNDFPFRYALTQIILTIPILVAGYRFYTVGFRALFKGRPNMDSLIAIGTSSAVLYSLYSFYLILQGDPDAAHRLYFESAGVIIALILLGKTLESISKGKTSEAIKKLMGLAPKTASVIKDGAETQIPIDQVEVGDIVLVRPGEKIPVDGIVTEGYTAVDESMLTGESMPADKSAGDNVFAASINKNGVIRFQASKIGKDTALAQIIKLVEDAQGSKAPIAKMADIVSGYFVPIVCAIAVITFAAWMIGGQSVAFSLTKFISVLVIACPCALGLATPTAIMVGTGKGAEYGILIKSGEALETAHTINAVILDKTGTLTEGKPEVTDIVPLPGFDKDRLLLLAGSAEMGSEHPLGEAIVRKAQSRHPQLLETKDFESLAGRGIKAAIDGQRIFIGNKKLMEEQTVSTKELDETASRLADEGKTPMFLAQNGTLAGMIAVADVVKKTSADAVKKLRSMGIEVTMITGDNKKTAGAIAKQLGIDRVLAEVLPPDKANEVKKLQAEGKKVGMVGDGINDAPALAQADIGIAIGSGTDVAMESADIVLMRNDPMDVTAAIRLSKSTIRNIKQNLFWAFAYNAAGIPIAAGVLYLFGGPLLNPMFAAAAMSLSSVSVLSNALRLKRFKPY